MTQGRRRARHAGAISPAGTPAAGSRNRNRVYPDGWSNPDSEARYRHLWPDEPSTAALYRLGRQCLSCGHFAPFDADWGLCCHRASRHFTETVFEHFTCPWHRVPDRKPDPSDRPKPVGQR